MIELAVGTRFTKNLFGADVECEVVAVASGDKKCDRCVFANDKKNCLSCLSSQRKDRNSVIFVPVTKLYSCPGFVEARQVGTEVLIFLSDGRHTTLPSGAFFELFHPVLNARDEICELIIAPDECENCHRKEFADLLVCKDCGNVVCDACEMHIDEDSLCPACAVKRRSGATVWSD